MAEAPLSDPEKAPEHAAELLKQSKSLGLIERFDVPLLDCYNDADQRLNAILGELLGNINWTRSVPLAGCLSGEYYWAQPARKLVGAQPGEDERLLGLSDLCHELGHILYPGVRSTLQGEMTRVIFEHAKERSASPPAVLLWPTSPGRAAT